MAIVWKWVFQDPLKFDRKVNKSVTWCGHNPKVVVHSPKVNRADGTGGISSYAGQNIITAKLDNQNNDIASSVIEFLQARIDGDETGVPYETFQIYHVSSETSGIDLAGTSSTGMYYVKFLGDLSWVIHQCQFHDFTNLVFHEDLTSY